MKAKKAILRQFFWGGGAGGNIFWKRRVAGNGLQGKADNRPLWLVCFVFPKKVPGELELCLFINYAYICM